MMNNLLKKSVKKVGLLSIVMAAIVVLAAVLTIVFGVNTAATISDNKTLTVKMSSYYYNNETQREKIETACETAFEGLNVEYQYKSLMSGDECEIMYVFDKDVDLIAAKTALVVAFSAAEYESAFLSVEQAQEVVKSAVPAVAIVRAAVAVLVFAILAFIYVAVRHGWQNGVVAAVAVLLSCILSAAVILLVRIPVTSSVIYACAVAPLLVTVFVLLGLNKLKADETDASVEEKVVSAIAQKETLGFTIGLGVALVLVGAIATWAVRWFALCALIALLVAAATALFAVPAMQLPLLEKKAREDASRSKSGYVGAKKTEENQVEA